MKKLRRIISMLMVLVLFIGILPMNLGVVKAEEALDDTTKLNNIKVRAYNSETEIWDDIGLTIKEYVGSKQDTIYTPIKFDPGRRLYQLNLNPKYKKIQFYIEKAYEEQVVEIESGESYKIRNSNYTEETVLQSGSNAFEFYVKPSNGSATREYFFSVDRGDTTKAYKIYLPIGYNDLKTAFEGDIVNIKASTDFNGKVFEKWIAPNNVEIKDPYIILNKFKMPNSDVTIKTQYRDSSEDGSKLKYIIVHAMKDNVWETFYDAVKVSSDTYDYELNLSGGYTDVYLTLQAEDILLNNSEGSLLKQLNNHIKIKVNGDSLSVDDFSYGFDTSKTVLIEEENLLNIKIISKNFKNTSDYTLKINNGEVKYKVSFDAGEGKGSMDAVEIAKGSTYELPTCTFEEPENKEFKAWSVNGKEKAVGEEITVDKDTEVIALWKDIMVSVSFNPGEGSGSMDSVEIAKGSTYELPKCTFEAPDNKEFKAWSVNNEEKAVGETITVNEDTVVKATWKDIIVRVSFNPGKGSGSMDPAEVVKGSTYTLPECTFTAPENKEFKAWSVDGKEKAVGDPITVNENTEVIALWKNIMVNVSFNPGDGKGSMDAEELVKGSKYTLPNCDFTAPGGQVFKAWEVNGKEKAVGDLITINEDTEVIAIWLDKPIEKYKVTLVANNGTDDTKVVEKEKGTEYTLPDCPFTAPDGQVFKAWKIGDKEYNPQEKITIDGETVITAIWQNKQIETVTVTLVANNNTDKTIVKEVKKGTDYTLPDCKFTAPEGQVFKAWKIGDKEYKPQDKIKIDGETIVRAIWQVKSNETDPDKPKPGEENPDEDNPGEKANPDEDNSDEDNSDEDKPGEEPNPDKPKPSEKHAINITPSPYGRVIIDPNEAKAGDKVSVHAIANYGYELVSLSLRDASGELLPINKGQFIMPDGEVDIYPIFREIAPYIDPEIYDKAEREEQKRRAKEES